LAVEADIDLMLLDFNIPVMDGLTLLARLREEQAPVKAIIVSAYSETPKLPDRRWWCATHYCGRQSATGGEIAEIVARLEDRGQHPLRGRNELVRISARPDQSVER
jgi:CheY-like chemotaxis protein